MDISNLSDAKRRILHLLKREGQITAAKLAESMGSTVVAARQHLTVLENEGLVQQSRRRPQGRGRPAALWTVAPDAKGLFPDRHGELTVDLLMAARDVYGDEGLRQLIHSRQCKQAAAYGQLLPGSEAPLEKKIHALAELRSSEGYMAEVRADGPGAFLLIEHHCPICDAARSCQGFCASEVELFRDCLGPQVHIERIQHLLSDGERCIYRVAECSE
jgi:predicted ArsR family transcriptional regulator